MGGGSTKYVVSFLGHEQLRVHRQKSSFHLFFACLDHRWYPNTLLSILGYSGPVVVPWLYYGY